MPPTLNKTFLSLIPKLENPCYAEHFRPISLCNFCYKIITKIFSSRLSPFLNSIISSSQSAFVKNRSIFDSVLITNELFQFFKHKKGKSGWFALKLEFEKAYDRISWDFLSLALTALGFHASFIHWIMCCVTTSSFQILVNGSPSSPFLASRGLRQGDHLSPSLFIICLEFLSLLIDKAVSNKSLVGFKACRGAPLITHSSYADDSIIFLKATHSIFH